MIRLHVAGRGGRKGLFATRTAAPAFHIRTGAIPVPKAQQSMASAALQQTFVQPDRASQTLRHATDQFQGKWP